MSREVLSRWNHWWRWRVSNPLRRRVGPEASLAGSYKGARPLVRSPRRGRTPFEIPGRGFEPLRAVVEAIRGGGGGFRTPDPRLMSPLLYHLSYTATKVTLPS